MYILSNKALTAPLVKLLRQGVTPDELALSLALGVCLSCFPVPGATTLLCTAAAIALGLNLAAIQLANYAAAPLQVLLLIPFVRLGERLFHSARLPLAPARLLAMYRAAPWHTARQLWMWGWHAIMAWLLVAPLACLLLTASLRAVLRRLDVFPGAPEPEESAVPPAGVCPVGCE